MPGLSVIPDDSFIDQYLKVCENFETARVFDLWGALFVLGNALGRDVIARPTLPIRMNWFTTFVAVSGAARKSTAVRFAKRVLESYWTGADDRLLISTKTTPEKLAHDMHLLSQEYGHAHTTICIDEMVHFLGREKYALAMPGLLTDLYDCPESRTGGGTLHEERTLTKVYLSFLSASTPTWLASAINPDVIEGGFTSRCIFVTAYGAKKSIPIPEGIDLTTAVNKLTDKLYSTVNLINVFGTTIELDFRARELFERWYNSRKRYSDPFRDSFQAREDDHILRMSALLAINAGTAVIGRIHLRHAIKAITQARDSAAEIFLAESVVDPDLIRTVGKVIDRLVKAGIHGDLQSVITKELRNVSRARTVTTILGVMHDRGMVEQFQLPSTGGRPAILWRATQTIRQPNVAASVARAVS